MNRRSSRISYVLFLAAACGGSSGGGGGGVTPAGNHTQYVINSITAPKSQADDAIIRVDQNSNPVETGGAPVNKLGGLIATLKQAGNLDIQTPLTAAVNDGSIILLSDFQTTDFTNAPGAGFSVFLGADPNPAACDGSADTTCGHQFSGSASFSIDPNNVSNDALAGPVVSGEFTSGPGDLTIEFSLATGGSGGGAPLVISLKDAHVKASGITAGGMTSITIGGAIPNSDIQTMLIPTVADQLNATAQSECTDEVGSAGCGSGLTEVGCTGGTNKCCSGNAGELIGSASVVELDANGDCMITAAELGSNSVVQGLLMPDVATTGNGSADGVSFGIGATATGAVFTAP
jgi:hypothetical protein|nr:hypothetical protein [Kofleriaceae bacterium]